MCCYQRVKKWGCTSVVEHLFSIRKIVGSSPSIGKTQKYFLIEIDSFLASYILPYHVMFSEYG